MGIDTSAARDRVMALRKRIVDPEDEDDLLCPPDRNALIEFDENLARDRRDNNRCGWYHHGNLLSRLYILSSETDALAATLDDEAGQDAVDNVTDWIHSQEYADYTVQGMLSALRVFADTTLDVDGDELPDRFANIEPGAHVDDDRSPMPSNVVEYDHMLQMVEAADHPRDKALIATEWDGGPRPMEELYTLQYKHVDIRDDHVVINFPEQDGKTVKRSLLLVVASPLLKRWIQKEHPVHDDPEAELGPDTFIWTRQDENKLPHYNTISERFRVAGEEAGLNVEHSAQHLRRSSASIYARKGATERHLRQRYGWSAHSPAPEHYVATFSTSTQIHTAHIRGRDIDEFEEPKDTAPVPCENCGDWTLRDLNYCVYCEYDRSDEQTTLDEHTMSNPHTAEELSFEEKILRGILTVDDLKTLIEVRPNYRAGEKIFEGLETNVERAKGLRETRSDTPNAVTGPVGLAGYYTAAAGATARGRARAKHVAMELHPGLEHYPPSPKRGAGIIAGQLAIVVAAVVTLSMAGILESLAAGEPTAVAALVISLVVGVAMVVRDLPTVDDAVEELDGV